MKGILLASPVKQTNAKLNHTGSAVVAWGGRFAGPLLALAVYYLLPEGKNQLSDPARATAAIGTLMAIWWMTEALPLPATSLLPLILFPLARVFPDAATGAQIEQAAAPDIEYHAHFFGYLCCRDPGIDTRLEH